MNKTTAYTITGTGRISAVINSKAYTVDKDHPNYARLLDSVKTKAWDEFVNLVNLTHGLAEYITGDIQISDGVIIYAGEILHNTLTKRILNFMQNDLPFEPLTMFLANLLQNPSKRAVDELYDFLEAGELPITEDGCFLAFKNVRADYFDIYSGTKNNAVGQKPEMPRNLVDEDKNRTCSKGLHFCSIKYLPNFYHTADGHTMILKINPRDVVAIPADYNNTKGRACTYEVVAEYTEDWRKRAATEGDSGFDNNLYNSNGGDYCGADPIGHDCESDDLNEEIDYWSDYTIGYERGCEDADKGVYNNPYIAKDSVFDDAFTGYEDGQSDTRADLGIDDINVDSAEIYGTKPSGYKFYNKRNAKGRFA